MTTREKLFENAMMKTSEMTTEELFRQTGRTGRMLKAAVEAARRGKAVVIVAKDMSLVNHYRDRIEDEPGVEVVHYNPKSTQFPVPFDWATLKGVGKYANHEVFIDHAVIYFNNRHLFEAATKWDPKVDIKGDAMTFVRDDKK